MAGLVPAMTEREAVARYDCPSQPCDRAARCRRCTRNRSFTGRLYHPLRMAISFVNGYLWTSCCDVAKASRGENPPRRPGGDKPGEAGDTTQAGDASRADPSRDQAVTFGGALATDAN